VTRTTRFGTTAALLAILLSAAACGDSPGGADEDTDGDTISDADEGDVDSDGDGTPDFQDTDSDNDGIPDAKEAGDADLSTPPADADGDGTPNYLDDDSDGNGILDATEGAGDQDGDGLVDAVDLDNDGDAVPDTDEFIGENADCDDDGAADTVGTPTAPQDCDHDGSQNYNDPDSDGDGVADIDERFDDVDGDGFLNRYDLDSDNDGISDKDEAGDNDPTTAPQDSDGDGTPNFLDPDSDDDGLNDKLENEAGSDPTKADTDGDGISDLIEVAAGTDATDPADNPQANGDFVFIVPYQQPTTPPEDTLNFRTSIQFADVYFAIDTSGSMSTEWDTMATQIGGIIDELTCDVVAGSTCALDSDCMMGTICFQGQCVTDPNVGKGCVPDMWTGVGLFNDLDTYENKLSLQSSATATAAALSISSFPGGSEAIYQPPACIANPAACISAGYSFADMKCASTGVGCPGYRPEAIRVLIQISDADDQCYSSTGGCDKYTPAYAGQALIDSEIKYVALFGTDDSGSAAAFTPVAYASQSVDIMGVPFVYAAANAAVSMQTVQAVLDIVKGKPIDVTIQAEDAPNDAGDALQFLDYLEVNVSGQNDCTDIANTADTDADTHDDAFPDLLPGVPVCWDVHPVLQQSTTPPTFEPQLFVARLKAKGDNSLIDERRVFFLVPPKAAEIPQ
jgi:hypothetical protein